MADTPRKKPAGGEVTEPGSECGSYSEIDDAAEACRVKEDCVGFDLKDGKCSRARELPERPSCLAVRRGAWIMDLQPRWKVLHPDSIPQSSVPG